MRNKLFYILPSLIVGAVICIAVMHFYNMRDGQIQNATSINNFSAIHIEELKSKLLITGDTNSYLKLRGAYRDMSSENFLFWAMYMANKFDYPEAYKDVYYSIEEICAPDSSILKMDEKTRLFALHYLKLAAQKNNPTALEKIEALKLMHIPTNCLKTQ